MLVQSSISTFWALNWLLSVLSRLHITIVYELRAPIKTISSNEEGVPLLTTLLTLSLILLLPSAIDINFWRILFQIKARSSLIFLFLVCICLNLAIHGILASLKAVWIEVIWPSEQVGLVYMIESSRMVVRIIKILKWICISWPSRIVVKSSLRLVHTARKVMLTLS